jgi:hypothetical protein
MKGTLPPSLALIRGHALTTIAQRAQVKAQAALNGRIFGTAKVQASFFEEAPFLRREF